ncbi:MAG: hypothetical protein IJA34_11355 [Lachnospiraceae bacterium]|nr:hypothetical protein [Lachnospiraceae bacterium]
MKSKYVISILAVLIAIGIVIGICIIRNDKEVKEVVLINKDKISYIEIQHKDALLKTESHEKIEKITILFEKEMKRDEGVEDKKGWIYKVSIYDENDKNINTIFILDENSIVVDGKGYRYDGQFVSCIEEISCIKRDNYIENSDKALIGDLFGVSSINYEIIHVDNTLSDNEYGGSYEVKIRIKEEDINSFISDIESTVSSSPLDEEMKSYESTGVIFKNITGREMKKDDVIYERLSSVQRKITNIFAAEPKTVLRYVMYSEAVNGSYEIDLAYLE